MINRIKSLLAFGALVAVSSASATEYRTPWVSERGPLRYSFDKLHEDKYNVNFWKVMHHKLAKGAFGRRKDCGSATKKVPITTLLFNKADFRLNEIFPDSKVPVNSECYNPFIGILRYKPRVHYYEWGATFGGRFDMPVYKDDGKVVGRFGVRATVPLRCIEIERKDITNKNANPLDDVTATDVVRVIRKANGTAADATNERDVIVKAWRLDFVKKLRDGNKVSPSLTFAPKDAMGNPVNGISLFGNVINFASDAAANVGVVFAAEGDVPRQKAFQYSTEADTVNFPDNTLAKDAQLEAIGTDGTFDNDTVGYPGNVSYAGLEAETAENAALLAQNWLVFRHQTEIDAGTSNNLEPDLVSDGAKKFLRLLEVRSEVAKEGIEDFLCKNCFEFETERRRGLGDIDIDAFYEHQFNEEWIAEVMLGVRLPTGAGENKCNNPYKVNLGNGGHFEVKIGGLAAYQPYSWMNVKVDGYWSFVLKDTEKRAAVFKGSKIKGIGPCVDADVDWNYGVFNFDLNFIHPKTKACRSMIGYQLYYKDDDNVCFKKCKSVQSWLGRKYETNTTTNQTELVANPQALDGKLAAANTNSIAHKLRSECSVMVNKYCEIFAGGAWTFAGKNVFCDIDGHFGFNCLF